MPPATLTMHYYTQALPHANYLNTRLPVPMPAYNIMGDALPAILWVWYSLGAAFLPSALPATVPPAIAACLPYILDAMVMT